MKKKILMVLTGTLLGMMLTACGGNEAKTIGGDVNTTVTDNNKEEEVVAVDDSEGADASYKGYVFEYNDLVIEIDANAKSYVDSLGEPNSYFEASSCAFEGLDKMYTYSSFELDTYPTNDEDFVSAIIFKDDSITTKEGIRIGSSKDDVISAYGDDFTEDVGEITYEKDDMRLKFVIADDQVASIEYSTKVLDQ